MDMEPLYLQQIPPHFNYASNDFEHNELDSLLNQLPPASLHVDHVFSNPNQTSISHSLCDSLTPSSFHRDRIVAAGLPNPNFHSASECHPDLRLREALPTDIYGDLRGGAGLRELAMPGSLHRDNGDDTGQDRRKPASFHGDHEDSATPINPNFKGETEGRRHSQMLQAPAIVEEGAASSDHQLPVPASKINKGACVRSASFAESLRRKKISQFFSKLEVLLPPDDVIKHDRCSLIDATIHYITTLEERVAKELEERKKFLDATKKIDQQVVGGVVNGSQNEESCKKVGSNEVPKNCSLVSSKKLEEYGEEEENGAQMISISMLGDESIFINVVTPLLEPLLLTSLLTVLHHHNLEIITATLTRTDKLYFSFFAKASLSQEYNQKSLKDAISRALKQA